MGVIAGGGPCWGKAVRFETLYSSVSGSIEAIKMKADIEICTAFVCFDRPRLEGDEGILISNKGDR